MAVGSTRIVGEGRREVRGGRKRQHSAGMMPMFHASELVFGGACLSNERSIQKGFFMFLQASGEHVGGALACRR